MIISHPLLSRQPVRPAPAVPLLPGQTELSLRQGRVHEASGPARRTLAIWLSAQTTGPVCWIAPDWGPDRLNSDGLCRWIDPARLLFITPRRAEDILWSMEEILRSGAVALSIADLADLPSLTHVRRMHLAAEKSGQSSTGLPLGMLLTPGQGGAAGVETRWHMRSDHHDGHHRWRLARLRARTAPRKTWSIQGAEDPGSLQIKPA